MGSPEKKDVREQAAVLEGLLNRFVEQGKELGPAVIYDINEFKRLFLSALRKLGSDRGKAMKRLYLKTVEMREEFNDEVQGRTLLGDALADEVGEERADAMILDMVLADANRAREDNLEPEIFIWLTDQQMSEWRGMLERLEILEVQ